MLTYSLGLVNLVDGLSGVGLFSDETLLLS
jgi:hypothetical protein